MTDNSKKAAYFQGKMKAGQKMVALDLGEMFSKYGNLKLPQHTENEL